MQCYHCGATIPAGNKLCPSCGSPRSRLIYVHLWGVVGGFAGSLLGFTFANMVGALVGGLLGIIACEIAAHWRFQSAKKA